MKVEYVTGKHKKIGDMTRIQFPNKSKIYITKKGMTIAVPKTIMEKQILDKSAEDISIFVSIEEFAAVLKVMKMVKK